MKSQITFVLCFLNLLVLFSACRSTEKKKVEATGESFSLINLEEGDTLSTGIVPMEISEWLHYYNRQDTGFTLNRFKASGVTLHIEALSPAIQSNNPADYFQFFLFSPDKKRYLDLVSYAFQLSDGKLVSGEADQQVVLADVNAQKRFQLLFYGPEQVAESGGWINNNCFMIAGIKRAEDGKSLRAELLLFDVRDSLYTNLLLDHLVQPLDDAAIKPDFLEQYFHDLKK